MSDRLEVIRRKFADWQIDGLLITSPTNRRWASGFTGSAGRLLITPERAILSTDSRYWSQAEQQATQFELHRSRDGEDNLRNLIAMGGGITRIGIEARYVTLEEKSGLEKLEDVQWVPLSGTLEPLRALKTDAELDAIRTAARLTDDTVAQVPRLARPGTTERAVAWELEKFMRDSGADGTAFEIIVASGPNSALPHHRPGDRVLTEGDIIVVDLGAALGGYKSDLTRTFYLGEAPETRFWEIYNTVHDAQLAAIAALRAGVSGKTVDSAARDIITAAGFGDYFGHGTGHAVGLGIHEEPRLSRLAEDVIIPAGAVMTVEPGIYLPDYGGVRIEDLVLVTPAEAIYLSAAPKTPLIPV